MTIVEVTEGDGQVSATVADETVIATVTVDGDSTAVEVPDSGAEVSVEGDSPLVEVDVPVATEAVAVVTTEVVEVVVPTPETVALPVADPPEVIEVVVEGPQGAPSTVPGPRGDPGPAGPGANYTHNQNIASSVWTIQHFLGFNPSVTAIDSAGTNIEGDLEYPDTDTVVLTLSAATGGTAYLS